MLREYISLKLFTELFLCLTGNFSLFSGILSLKNSGTSEDVNIKFMDILIDI